MSSLASPRLVLWRDISPTTTPLRRPTPSSARVLVIGAGVTGLVTAWVLLDAGYFVTVLSKGWVSEEPGERLTSQIAGALWEYPPAVCGGHTNGTSLDKSKKWSMTSYHIWNGIAEVEGLSDPSGVRMMPSAFFFRHPIEDDHQELAKMEEIMASGVRGFRRDKRIVEEQNISPDWGAADAYQILAPVIDTDKAMQWLTHLVQSKGAHFVRGEVPNDLVQIENALLSAYNADVIVNATGMSAKTLAGDHSCYPVRGSLIRLINDGSDFPQIKTALAVSAKSTADEAYNEKGFIFLVPRNDNILVMGGTAELYQESLCLTIDSPNVEHMRSRCEAFLPSLKKARVDRLYPFAQGLRPCREMNVRVGRELRSKTNRIVHSYGHGGSGWSLSFGCAQEVLRLVRAALAGEPVWTG